MTAAMPEPGSPRAVLLEAAHRCVDLLLDSTVVAGDQLTWPTWEVAEDGTAARCRGGRSLAYDGDAGIAWALGHLGSATERDEAAAVAALGARSALGRRLPAGGWLSGRPGVLALVADLPESLQHMVGPAVVDDVRSVAATDLTGGVAGALLARTRTGGGPAPLGLVRELRQRSREELWGRSWPDPEADGDEARPLCGLAHGASGIVWALAEAAARWPELSAEALALADEGLAWESTWLDPARGGWPDLRAGETTWPARWCHGSAGAGAVRARLLQLAAQGLTTPWPQELVRSDLEVAVQSCGAEVAGFVADVREHDAAALGAGLTICHGLGGPVGLLDLAADVLDEPRHRDLAVEAATVFLDAAGTDPGAWPSGVRGADGDLGLLNGVAGTALLLARLALPGAGVATPVLPGVSAGRHRPGARRRRPPYGPLPGRGGRTVTG
ncbi:hypothetical protein DDE18_08430 [Nocardioides gansuensis]|uniref:Lanthionine synthetase n=1 Tax=Nocardioides gansuensis TaxID=2138300 RepID=A0A2T8FC82_9ACTN|nr:lanthionine synthetase LanC family protein [Nocardioides gansuensis]PVG83312.1 hypothetical protein DDE18_08430 [Nocardioides gansuensis]